MHIYKAEEWQSPSGKWLCGDVSALAADSNDWTYPMQIFDLTPEKYVKLLIHNFNANVHYNSSANVLIFSFSSLTDCRKFKNLVNKKAREKNFITY